MAQVMNSLLPSSVQISSVQSDSLQPHELKYARPPCPSSTPRVHPNSCPSSRWCQPVVPFSSCPQSLPSSVFSNESTLCMRWPKYWSFSFSISPSKEYLGLISFRIDWFDLFVSTSNSLKHHWFISWDSRQTACFLLECYGFGNDSHRKINYNNEKNLSLEKFSLFHDFCRDHYTGGLSELHFWKPAEYKVLFEVLEEYKDEWDIVTFLKEFRD